MTNITQDPVAYMERTRKYYRALGYDQDYVWSHFDDVPFAPLGKALSHCRIGFVTTASPARGTTPTSTAASPSGAQPRPG